MIFIFILQKISPKRDRLQHFLADMCILQAQRIAQNYIFLEYPMPKIPDVFENKLGMNRVLPKIIGSGRLLGTRQALHSSIVES